MTSSVLTTSKHLALISIRSATFLIRYLSLQKGSNNLSNPFPSSLEECKGFFCQANSSSWEQCCKTFLP